eukprot:Hpha_TRINITY_DN18547_c0_g1::TRINITY_DN18547_c0_g1_i1::g.195197::m.195197
MADLGLSFSRTCCNDFQWRNLYIAKYGECTYTTRNWRTTFLARERSKNLPVLWWILDPDYSFEHIRLLFELSRSWGPGVQATLIDDVLLLMESNSARTSRLLCWLVNKAVPVDFTEDSGGQADKGLFNKHNAVRLVFARYCRLHGAAFLKRWLRPVLMGDAAGGLFSPSTLQRMSGVEPGSDDEDKEGKDKDKEGKETDKDKEKEGKDVKGSGTPESQPAKGGNSGQEGAAGKVFLKQLEEHRARDARRVYRATIQAAETVVRRLRSLRNELHPGIWTMAVLAQRRFDHEALAYLEGRGCDIRLLGIAGTREGRNPVGRQIVNHTVLRALLIDTWLLPGLMTPEEWAGEDVGQHDSVRKRLQGISKASFAGANSALRSRFLAQGKEELHSTLKRVAESISVERPDSDLSGVTLDAGGLRVQKELLGCMEDLMQLPPPSLNAKEVIVPQEVQEAALGNIHKMLRRFQEELEMKLEEALPPAVKEVLVGRMRSVLRECDEDVCRRRQQRRDDFKKRW